MIFEIFRDVYSVFNKYHFWDNFRWSLNTLNHRSYNILIYSFLLATLFMSVFYFLPAFLFIPVGIVLLEAYVQMTSQNVYLLEHVEFDKRITKEDFTIKNSLGLTVIFISRFFLTLIGAIFFVFPGFYIYVKLAFARHCYLYYDDNIIQAMVKSWKITKGNSVKLMLLYFYIMFVLFFSTVPYLVLMVMAMSQLGWSNLTLGLYSLPLFFLIVNIHNVILQSMATRIFMNKVTEQDEDNDGEDD